MGLIVITPPADLPVSLAEQKAWSRIDANDEDALILAAIDAATGYVQTALGRSLVTATYELVLDAFPCGPIKLSRPPLQSVTSVG